MKETKANIKKGLDALLNADIASTGIIKNTATKEQVVEHLPIELFKRGSYQPRLQAEKGKGIENLTQSIKEQGIIQPLIVRLTNKQYEIIAGERRWHAAKLAGMKEIPAIIQSVSDKEAAIFALIENLQREDLNPIEEAKGYHRLIQDFNLTHKDIAKKIGKSRTTITNMLRLLNLCAYVRNLVEEGRLEMGHARVLLSLSEDNQRIVADNIIEKKLSVRATEQLIQNLNQPKKQDEPIDPAIGIKITEWENRIAAKLCNNIKIKLNNAGQGKVTIPINSLDEIKWLVHCIERG